MDRQINGQMYRWITGQMDKWMDGLMVYWIDGDIDKQKEVENDGQIDG